MIKLQNWITSISTLLIAITSIVGLYFLVEELGEIRKQNELTERAFRTSYMPIGAVESDSTLDGPIHYSMQSDRPDLFDLYSKYDLRNIGNGVLVYVGSFSHLSTRKFNFREQLLLGAIDTLEFDRVFAYARRNAVLPEKLVFKDRTYLFSDLQFEEIYYEYTIFLYEDLDGRLYDTHHMTVHKFIPPSIKEGSSTPTIDRERTSSRTSYYVYSELERDELVKAIRNLKKPLDHPLADVIEKGAW